MEMEKRPCLITLMVYIRFLHADGGVCYTEYDMQDICLDCCYGTPLSKYNNVNSAIACCELCSGNEQCRSIQYDPSKKDCWTNGEKITAIDTSCSNLIQYGEINLGSCHTHRMFEPCNNDTDCPIANSACPNGKCECKDGHPYDYRFDSCPTECTKYGNTFHEVGYYIWGNNTATYEGVSVDECLERCVTNISLVCRFVEFSMTTGHTCSLSELNALTADDYPSDASQWRQWDQNCAQIYMYSDNSFFVSSLYITRRFFPLLLGLMWSIS